MFRRFFREISDSLLKWQRFKTICSAICGKVSLCATFFIATAVFMSAEVDGKKSDATSEVFRMRLREDMGTLDWNYGEVNVDVVLQLMEGLISTDAQGEPVPAIAEKWKRSKDGKAWTFFLKKNAVWSDGTSVCAQNFVDSLKRVLSPGHSPYAHYYFDLRDAKAFNTGTQKDFSGARAEECHRLEISLERPIGYLPSLMSHFTSLPVRLDLIQKHGDKWMRPENLAVNGPYRLRSWVQQQRYVLEANPKYAGPTPAIQNIELIVVPDDATALTLFETKKLDWMRDIPTQDRERVRKMPEFHSFPSHIGYYLGMNVKEKPFDNIYFRRALAQSLNLSEIPQFLRGGETPAEGWFPSAFSQSKKPRLLSCSEKDARENLKKSGVDPTQALKLFYYMKDAHVPMMEWVQQQWSKVLGLRVEIIPVEGKVYWAEVQLKKYPLFLSGISAFVNNPLPFLTELMSDSHANWTHWSSKKYDDFVQKASVASTTQVMLRHAAQAEAVLLREDVVGIPLYFRANNILVRSSWKNGVWVNPLNYVYVGRFGN